MDELFDGGGGYEEGKRGDRGSSRGNQNHQRHDDPYDGNWLRSRSDDWIKRMLASKDKNEIKRDAKRELGLLVLDAKKEEACCGQLRIWSSRYKLALSAGDLLDIWEATMDRVKRQVRSGKFKRGGRLDGYLRRIAWCRMMDHLRASFRVLPDFDLGPIVDPRQDPPHQLGPPFCSGMERGGVLRAIFSLSVREFVAIKHYVGWYSELKGPPPIENVVQSANEELAELAEKPFLREAYKSAKARAIRKIRKAADEENKENANE